MLERLESVGALEKGLLRVVHEQTSPELACRRSSALYPDWVVASIHSPCIPGLLTEKEATRLWLALAENPYVDCIGHSEQQNYRYDYDLVTKAFAKNHKVVELNGNSVNVRRDGIPNMKLLLAACLKNGCHIALDTLSLIHI